MAFVIMERLFRAFDRPTQPTKGGGEELGFFACHNSSRPTRDSFKAEIYGRASQPGDWPDPSVSNRYNLLRIAFSLYTARLRPQRR